MAGEATHPDLINGSLVGILSELEQDKTFLKLAAGDIEASDDVDNSVLAGIPEGLRPALAAAWPCSADSSIRAIPIRCSARFAFSSCRSARSSSQSSKDWAMSSRSCSPWGRTCPSTKPPNV